MLQTQRVHCALGDESSYSLSHTLPTAWVPWVPTLTVYVHCTAEIGAAQGIGHFTGYRL